MTRTHRVVDGEGFEIGYGERFRFGCCDCGLTHDVVIVEERAGVLGVALRRNARSTAARKRYIKRPCLATAETMQALEMASHFIRGIYTCEVVGELTPEVMNETAEVVGRELDRLRAEAVSREANPWRS